MTKIHPSFLDTEIRDTYFEGAKYVCTCPKCYRVCYCSQRVMNYILYVADIMNAIGFKKIPIPQVGIVDSCNVSMDFSELEM